MTIRKLLVCFCLLLISTLASAKDAPRSFSLSTSRTFSPGESVKIQLFARNVPELDFRVYKVHNAEKFFSALKDIHSFGEHNQSPDEQIDQRTLLERIHDWKAHLWWRVRHFFRGQFTDDARDSFREQQGKLGKRDTICAGSNFERKPAGCAMETADAPSGSERDPAVANRGSWERRVSD
jgi:alpha-2-macroglobulin